MTFFFLFRQNCDFFYCDFFPVTFFPVTFFYLGKTLTFFTFDFIKFCLHWFYQYLVQELMDGGGAARGGGRHTVILLRAPE